MEDRRNRAKTKLSRGSDISYTTYSSKSRNKGKNSPNGHKGSSTFNDSSNPYFNNTHSDVFTRMSSDLKTTDGMMMTQDFKNSNEYAKISNIKINCENASDDVRSIMTKINRNV